MTGSERDPILDRLREVDPARADDRDEPLVRAQVKRRAEEVLTPSAAPKRFRRTGLLLAGAGAIAALVAAVAVLGGGDGLAPGPERALAIQTGPNGITLTIEDADASAEEMNRELEEAGIDRVRVISVPGSPNHAGTWGGTIDLASSCLGGTRKVGFGIRIAYHPDNGVPAPGRDFVDLKLPQRGEVTAGVTLQSGAGKRAIVSKETIGDPDYAPAILVAIHPRSSSEPESAKRLTAEDLIGMGGVFAPFGEAMGDGEGTCSELGLEPLPEPTFPPPGDWITIPIVGSRSGAERMTEQLRAAGIDGRFRPIPAQPEEVGRWLGFARRPPFGADQRPTGNRFDLITGDPAHPEKPSGKVLAIRREALAAYPDAQWIFYVGVPASELQPAQVITFDGPKDAAATLENRCKGASRVTQPNGHRWCASVVPAQVPRP